MAHSNSRKRINAISNRNTSDDDFEIFFETVEATCKRIHGKLTRHLTSHPIDEGTFIETCWEHLVEKDLLVKIDNYEFQNDQALVGYLSRSFENIFLDLMESQSPGFTTRKKQVHRVLKPHCLESHWKGAGKREKSWKLCSREHCDTSPASSDVLFDAANYIPLPLITYNRFGNARRGPRIKDADMARYMVAILEKSGGEAGFQAMYAFIHKRFCSSAVAHVSPPPSTSHQPHETPEIVLEQMAATPDKIMAGADHHLMARELGNHMAPMDKILFYHRFVKDLKQKETAEKMNKSIATISNMESQLIAGLTRHFKTFGSQFTVDEFQIVMGLLKGIIYDDTQALP